MIAPTAEHYFEEYELGKIQDDGCRELVEVKAGRGSARHSLYEAHDPWVVTRVDILINVRGYLLGYVLLHPCWLTLKNEEVLYGENTVELPGDILELV